MLSRLDSFPDQKDFLDLLFWCSLVLMSISPCSTVINPKSYGPPKLTLISEIFGTRSKVRCVLDSFPARLLVGLGPQQGASTFDSFQKDRTKIDGVSFFPMSNFLPHKLFWGYQLSLSRFNLETEARDILIKYKNYMLEIGSCDKLSHFTIPVLFCCFQKTFPTSAEAPP